VLRDVRTTHEGAVSGTQSWFSVTGVGIESGPPPTQWKLSGATCGGRARLYRKRCLCGGLVWIVVIDHLDARRSEAVLRYFGAVVQAKSTKRTE